MTATDVDVWVQDIIDSRWQSVLEAIEKRQNYTVAPWQPLDREPRLESVAFRTYLDSVERSVNGTASQLDLDKIMVRQWANQWEWERRAELYDQWAARQMDEARDEKMRQITFDNTVAFSRLPALVEMCSQLVQGSLAHYVRQAQEGGPDSEPLPLAMALKVSESMRGLMSETNRFLGTRVDVNVNLAGKVDHQHSAVTINDLENFLSGLGDAGLAGNRPPIAIETVARDEDDDGDT